MFDRFIYLLLDWIVEKCEKIREWKIKRSLPGPKITTPGEWYRGYKKWQKSNKENVNKHKNNDDCQ